MAGWFYRVTSMLGGILWGAVVILLMAEPMVNGQVKETRGGRPGEIITPPAKGERLPDQLKVGDPAPDFSLPLLAGGS